MSHTIIITMAGQGQRFQMEGYSVPKYEIPVKGWTLFCWALSSLQNFIDSGSHVVFVARRETNPVGFITQECSKLGISHFDVVQLEHLTDGQATTAMAAKQVLLQGEKPILIYNIDTHVDPAFLKPSMVRGEGWIPCFPGKGDAWSFVSVDEHNRAIEVREKKRISSHATIGLYGFSSFDIFENAYNKYYQASQNLEHRETYIAPLYNQLIQDNQAVFMESLPEHAIFPLGTPDEVKAFNLDYTLK